MAANNKHRTSCHSHNTVQPYSKGESEQRHSKSCRCRFVSCTQPQLLTLMQAISPVPAMEKNIAQKRCSKSGVTHALMCRHSPDSKRIAKA